MICELVSVTVLGDVNVEAVESGTQLLPPVLSEDIIPPELETKNFINFPCGGSPLTEKLSTLFPAVPMWLSI